MGLETTPAGIRRFGTFAVIIVLSLNAPTKLSAQGADQPGRVRAWSCRLVVKPTLAGVVEDGWRRSATLQRQCRQLADARAVVVLEWGHRADSQLRALSTMRSTADGIVVAQVSIPPGSNAIELVAHELEHVIERTEGLDYAAESKRPGSGVWETRGIFETQRANDAGRQAAKEVLESRRVSK